jgi:ribosomal protein S5
VAELIAEDEPKPALEGTGPVGDVLHLGNDLFGDGTGWEGLVDGAMCGLDILMYCENPLGGLIAAGVGWLLEHVPGVSDVWDKLTGDAGAIEQIAGTWDNISKSLDSSHSSYATSASQIEKWSGPAAKSYAQVSNAYATAIAGASTEAEALSIVVRLIGGLVAGTKDIVYDLISEFIEFTVLPAILGAIATSWCTFGGSIAVAVTYIEIQADITAGQVTLKITHTSEQIVVVGERTVKVVGKLGKMERALKELAEALEKNKSLAKKLLLPVVHGEVEQAH